MAVIPVFVSSTFRDFHAERDCLTRDVAARLDEMLAPLGFRVEMIDLRWGIDGTAEEDEAVLQNRVLSVCLDELDRARPLFVALLGDRYGWVPPQSRLAAVARDAGIDDLADGDWSITALEVEVGALRSNGSTPVLFVRNLVGTVPPDWVDLDRDPQSRFRARVADTDRGIIRQFEVVVDGARATHESIQSFEDLAVETLAPLVLERAEIAQLGRGDPYSTAEQLFFEDHLAVVEGRHELLSDLMARVHDGNARICLVGESGTGKSTIWASTAQALRAVGVEVLSVAVGIVPGTTSELDVATRLLGDLGLPTGGIDDAAVVRRLHAALEGREVVVAVDALDGLDAGPAVDRLRLFVGMPSGPSVLSTTTSQAQAGILRQAGFTTLNVGPLDVAAVASMVRGLARERRRQLPEPAVAHLVERDRTPLWVQLAFDELLALDEDDFASLTPGPDAVADLVTRTARGLPTDIGGLADRVIARSAERNGANATAWVLGASAVSRSGLTHADLAQMSGAAPVLVAGVRRRAASLLQRRSEGDRLRYRHGLLRSAAWDRFVESEADWHRSIATHLMQVRDASDAVVGDRLFHALLGFSANGAAAILEAVDTEGGGSTAIAYALTDALRRAELDHADPTVILTPTEVLGPGALVVLTWWLTHPARHGCRATTRRQVAARAVEVAQRFQPMWIDLPKFGTRWAAGVRQKLRQTLSATELEYFDWITSSGGQTAHLRLAVALRSEALMMVAAGEKRLSAQQILQQSEVALKELHAFLAVRAEQGGLDEDGQVMRRRVLEQLIETTEAQLFVELGSDIQSKERLKHRAELLSSLAAELSQLDPRSSVSLRKRLRALDAHAAVASNAELHDEAVSVAGELLLEARSAASQLSADQGYEELRRALLRVGQVTLKSGDRDRALSAAEQHVDLARRLQRSDPADADYALALLVGLELHARALGDDAGAEQPTVELVDLARAHLEADPSALQVNQLLSDGLQLRGDQLRRSGDGAGASAAFDEALAIRKPMQRKGHAGDVHDLVGLDKKRREASLAKRGGVLGRLVDAGDKAKVVKSLKPRITESERLTARVEAAMASGDFDTALESAVAALEIDLEIAEKMERWPYEPMSWVSLDYRQIGKCHDELRNRREAVEAFSKSAEVARALHRLYPDDHEVSAGLFESLYRLGRILVLDDRQYRIVWREAVDVSGLWMAQKPRELEALRGHCDALLALSHTVSLAEDPASGLALLNECVDRLRDLMRRTSDVTPDAAGYRNALLRLARARLEVDDVTGAAEVLDELVACERAALGRRPEGGPLRLARALRLSATAKEAAGDQDTAVRLAKEAASLDPDGSG